MTASHVNDRVGRYRKRLREAGLRPLQIWVPDTRRPGFSAECRRQSRRIARAEHADAAMQAFLDEALTDIEGWAD